MTRTLWCCVVCVDREQTTKWVTTGSFPQEVVVQLATTASISRVKTWSTNIKEVAVEVCSGPTPTKWEKLYESSASLRALTINRSRWRTDRRTCSNALELSENDGNLQIETESVKLGDASFIKFKILAGWSDFVTLHRVSVEGSTSRR